eukprot:CAMPEP_0177619062 /NCGR_PEP_ID=MMETSP0419_2-20121207/26021_1 /TAXON_ID=582737 /ORGANISM="Tetraselmis sp., Strain GSL018" /LENGTH=547 /DNA_ID=CAMNT_0019118227 /DNA_START=87 /DNA_END=1730 /DNA_ORIENTATION=-
MDLASTDSKFRLSDSCVEGSSGPACQNPEWPSALQKDLQASSPCPETESGCSDITGDWELLPEAEMAESQCGSPPRSVTEAQSEVSLAEVESAPSEAGALGSPDVEASQQIEESCQAGATSDRSVVRRLRELGSCSHVSTTDSRWRSTSALAMIRSAELGEPSPGLPLLLRLTTSEFGCVMMAVSSGIRFSVVSLASPQMGSDVVENEGDDLAGHPDVSREEDSASETTENRMPEDTAIITHPNSEVVSLNSNGSPGLGSPSSADLIIASADVLLQRESVVDTWLQLPSSLSLRTTDLSDVVTSMIPAFHSDVDEDTHEVRAVHRRIHMTAHDCIVSTVRATVERIWEWAAGKVMSVQSALRAMGVIGGYGRRGCLSLESGRPAKPGPTGRGPAMVILALGASNVCMGVALAAAVCNNRLLSMRLRQKESELSALILKVFSLQESLQGGSHRYPLVCHAMAPVKPHSYIEPGLRETSRAAEAANCIQVYTRQETKETKDDPGSASFPMGRGRGSSQWPHRSPPPLPADRVLGGDGARGLQQLFSAGA